MTEISAKVILDSVSPTGDRLTTLECTFHRFILAEVNTHRVFSRNSASSRAVPVRKKIEQVRTDPALPVAWPSERPGMQGGNELNKTDAAYAKRLWKASARSAVSSAEHLMSAGVHKSVVNRVLEPFMWHTAIITSTEWDGFYRQRCSPLAQPEFRVLAEKMRDAIEASEPTTIAYGHWHKPYLRNDDYEWVHSVHRAQPIELKEQLLQGVSAARCARVSYLTHDGVRDPQKDLELYNRLVEAEPPHASPLEHVARPARYEPGLRGDELSVQVGNLKGWRQLRHEVLGF